MAMTRENSQEPDREEPEDNTLVSAPMASLFEVTKLRNLRSYSENKRHDRSPGTTLQNDFISRGLVSQAQAEELFRIFSGPLNQYLWGGIALVHDSLDAVRKSSSLLLAAILAVTALHVPGNERVFDIAYSEFLTHVSGSMFDRYHSLDDVRALAIGAFWLSDVSWKLSGHAVRIATELQLHLSFAKAIEGHQDHVEKGRLWAFLYVCDHHFSIAYGRPPVIHEDLAITNHEAFLQLPGITNADFRLHSQVSMFVILSRIYQTFGPDSTKPLNAEGLKLLHLYNSQLDEWKMKWESRLAPNPHINTYPSKGVFLHYQFGKLQLNSLALRGVAPSTLCDTSPESSERRLFANRAVQNAVSALDIVLEEPDMRRALVGVPIYLLTTVTFATVFLLKVRLNWHSACLDVDSSLILNLVERIVELLRDARASDRHLARHISKGLRNLVDRFKEQDRQVSRTASSVSQHHISIPAVPANAAEDFQTMENQMAWPHGQMDFGTMWGDFDSWGMDENYLPLGMFNTLASQIPG
ncbi:hypothetical protein H2201_003545 [Coniosporium apollinis]|uniref:Xylanolytic transcriptional activator regulatory domain-containing protein n=2 Tax=Coniosporium TaxID=2810619 RepID=A0ABQ9NW84_9PEZI|nr:hypothetical protein H2199_008054 [Cladosporium sp. JES 115]KAJ9666357.1 hypothetical protein H2201_003545 [Coniosporium apollinis]